MEKPVPVETPLTTLYRVWWHCSQAEHLRFLTEVLTPTERRLLLFGLDDGEQDEDWETMDGPIAWG